MTGSMTISAFSVLAMKHPIDTTAAQNQRERQPASPAAPGDGFREQLDAAVTAQGWQSIPLTGFDQ